ncbi:hypothetical protein [Streptomyces antibioticus]|uniref:Uncharacterized protein n=1 Tax=Streptomyces antibioticus TaxID=1890 RepID=A0AAE6YDD3_STRAT|nr:hypothetical protein [Streptomyces antibioticus]OOQ47301.1 hypothetical protein AFM16_31670 [Streptomyces antibioticus]QIT47623.1 hypothetical protein HCX60_32225 [Streptomyces antibioticus]
MTTVLQIPTPHGHTVNITAADTYLPYTWTCTGGHTSRHGYASLPFARRDAQTHADTCQPTPSDPASRVGNPPTA